MKKLLASCLLLAVPVISACEDSNAVFVEHLAIVNINPSHGAVGIGYDTDVVVTFSDVLDPQTVVPSTVCLTSEAAPPPDAANPCGTGSPIAATVTSDALTNSARVDPAQPLDPGVRYTLHLMPTVSGAEAGPLPAIVTASFTTIPTS